VVGAAAGEKYVNPATGFESYFLRLGGDARLEVMARPDVPARSDPPPAEVTGWAHVAFSLGSEHRVDELTEELRAAGVEVVDGPRRTGDGYYESVVLDPDGNRVELTA
jgi:lactoylglutathione lyase